MARSPKRVRDTAEVDTEIWYHLPVWSKGIGRHMYRRNIRIKRPINLFRDRQSNIKRPSKLPNPNMTQTTSIRIEGAVLEEAKAIARRRGVSMNRFVDRALRAEIARARDDEMYEAASLLGQDSESDVDFALAAQAELALKE
ncbi:MAG TPA: hypothetical protein VKT77_03675 [Chthonomonadaceae bacterium]|nr:hypothetical protein [Chthonomonadaceae bacterium]